MELEVHKDAAARQLDTLQEIRERQADRTQFEVDNAYIRSPGQSDSDADSGTVPRTKDAL